MAREAFAEQAARVEQLQNELQNANKEYDVLQSELDKAHRDYERDRETHFENKAVERVRTARFSEIAKSPIVDVDDPALVFLFFIFFFIF